MEMGKRMLKVGGSTLVAILGLSIIGARLQNNYLLYTMLGLICLFVMLVAFDKIDKRVYPYAAFTIGLALLYQTTLMSNGLVGTDIHTEYYYYWLAVNQGWDISLPYPYNSCIGIVFIAPFLAKVLHIDGIWFFKAICPFLFAFVPVLLFLIFKKQFGEKVAFLSVFFLIAVPVWSLEMIAVPRQMLGELMLAICAYLIIVSNSRLRIKVPLLGICAVLGAMFHYVMGPTIFLYLSGSTVALLFSKRRSFPVKWLATVIGILIISIIGWYGLTSSGVPLKSITWIAEKQIIKVEKMLSGSTTQPSEVIPEKIVPEEGKPEIVKLPAATPNPDSNLTDQQPPLIRTAFGLDFADASVLGKAFRIFQYMTQLFLIIGCLYLFIKRRKYSPAYLGLAGTGALIIPVCILVPGSIGAIGTTRIYHLALLFLAPALVLGGQFIFRNLRILTVCLIIPYFLFTSGILFEAFQHEDASKPDVPYSIALSHNRVDVAAVFTDNDMIVRDWAIENGCFPMFLDINGTILWGEKTGEKSWHYLHLTDLSTLKDGHLCLPEDTSKLPDKYYIFLREWNIQNEKVTFQTDWYKNLEGTLGARQTFLFKDIGLDKTLETSKVLYRRGDAVIYGNN